MKPSKNQIFCLYFSDGTPFMTRNSDESKNIKPQKKNKSEGERIVLIL